MLRIEVKCYFRTFTWKKHLSAWDHVNKPNLRFTVCKSCLIYSKFPMKSAYSDALLETYEYIHTPRNPVSCTQIYFYKKLWSEFNLMFRVSYEYNWVYSVHIRIIRVGMSCETPYTAGVPSGSHTTGMAGIADVCGSLSRKTNMPASAAR